MSWRDFFDQYAETLGIALVFGFGGSGFVLWLGANRQPITPGQALSAISAALLVTAIATAFVHGYLGWNIFLAPFVGFVCGLVALPIIRAVIKGGQRVETRADDITDGAIDRVAGKKGDA